MKKIEQNLTWRDVCIFRELFDIADNDIAKGRNIEQNLTWRDVCIFRELFDIADNDIAKGRNKWCPMTKEYYEEILCKFLERKNGLH